MNKSSLKIFQPGLQPNSEQKVDNYSVSQPIAKPQFMLAAVKRNDGGLLVK
jgi:hypothetical protein